MTAVDTVQPNSDNMIACAQASQLRDAAVEQDAIKVIAPAKVNLSLMVGNKLPSGYHQVDTVLHALALHDTVIIRSQPLSPDVSPDSNADADAQGLRVQVAVYPSASLGPLEEIPIERNIAYKAAHALTKQIGRHKNERLIIKILKDIPLQAGLGGGSADAAATLVGLCQLWGINPQSAEVLMVAQHLGSDVPFFLKGGCAQFTGKGDEFVRSLPPLNNPLVLVKPSYGVSTKEAYRVFDDMVASDKSPNSTPSSASPNDGKPAADTSQNALEPELFNNLAPAAEQLLPDLTTIREWLSQQLGSSNVLLCGSGATTFGICSTLSQATSIATQARKQGWWSRTTSLNPLKAIVIKNG